MAHAVIAMGRWMGFGIKVSILILRFGLFNFQ